jgi:hypothetical protein
VETSEQGLHAAMTLILRFYIGIAICTLTTAVAQSPASLLSSSEVARLLGYPENRIQTRDLTEAAKRQLPQAIIATEYYSDDGTFAPIIISLAAEKSILTPSLLKDTETYFQKAQAQAFVPAVRKVDLGGGIQGIAGLGGFGPGATEERIIVNVPGRMDVLLKITIPGDGLNVDADTEGYHRMITGGDETLEKKLIECAKVTLAAAARMPSLFAEQPQKTFPPVPALTPTKSPPTPTMSTSNISPVVQTESSKSRLWPWIIGAILLLAVLGGILFKLRRK